MLAVDTITSHTGLSQGGSFSVTQLGTNPIHPPRSASLAGANANPKNRIHIAGPKLAVQLPRAYKDIKIDHWTRKIFSIISHGPAGGFVSYAISPTNELFVDRTGNRAGLEDVINDLLPAESCRYIAYKLRFTRNEQEKYRVIWIMWTPKEVSQPDVQPFLNGLAGTLIGLNCPSSIPIIKAKSANEITLDGIVGDMSKRRTSISTTSADSARTSTS